jgi:hypothetical protein
MALSVRAGWGNLLGRGRPSLRSKDIFHLTGIAPAEKHPEDPSFVTLRFTLGALKTLWQALTFQPAVMLVCLLHEKPEDYDALWEVERLIGHCQGEYRQWSAISRKESSEGGD